MRNGIRVDSLVSLVSTLFNIPLTSHQHPTPNTQLTTTQQHNNTTTQQHFFFPLPLSPQGLLFKHAGDRDAAIAAYSSGLALQPDTVEILVNLGDLLGDAGRRDEARAMLRRGIG